jgi:hypothetical protein
MSTDMATFAKGTRVLITGLAARADLNERHATVISWASDSRRWAITVEESGENVRVKPRNLTLVVPASGPIPHDDEEEEPIVLSKGKGAEKLVVRPERLKRRFQEVSQKYVLEERSDRVADFMMGMGSVTAELFASEFETSEADAEDFMMWINVSLLFKEQHMQAVPPGGQAS